jgi:hypothetical protein
LDGNISEEVISSTFDPSESVLKRQRTLGIEGVEDMNLVSNLELEEYGQLFDKARELRINEWKLLSNPQSLKPPTRIVEDVTEFINTILKDREQLKAIPTLKDTYAAGLKLRDDELSGEVRESGESLPEIVKDRVLIGRDTPANELIFCSQYSMCLKIKDSPLKKLMRDTIPADLIPKEGDDKAELQRRMLESRYTEVYLSCRDWM